MGMNLADCMIQNMRLERRNEKLLNELLEAADDAEFYSWIRDPENIRYLADMIECEEITTAADVDATVRRELVGGAIDGHS